MAKEPRGRLVGIGLPEPLKRQLEIKRCQRLLVLEQKHGVETAKPVRFGNLNQRFHAEGVHVDFLFLKGQEVGLSGVGLVVHQKLGIGIQRRYCLLVF